jgi:hypothetical protein
MIVQHLPSLTGSYAATVFNFGLEEHHWQHSSIWNIIWEHNRWPSLAEGMGLQPLLIGNLPTLRDYLGPTTSNTNASAIYLGQPLKLALLAGDKTGQIRFHREELLSSLRPHHLNERQEVVFHNSNIILNIDDAVHCAYYATLSPDTLFTYSDSGLLQSGSLYWRDSEYAVRVIGIEDVVGIGGPASISQDISLVCGITLTHPKEMKLADRRQYLFQHPSCPEISPLLPIVYNKDGGWILGWEFTGGEVRHARWHL